jgi:hypothetical protein
MMPHWTRSAKRRQSGAWRLFTVLAMLAQCWIAAAPLADSRGFGAGAHVEAGGTNKHFAHDEATCAACTVMALLGDVPPQRSLQVAPADDGFAGIGDHVRAPSLHVLSTHSSRAPPR